MPPLAPAPLLIHSRGFSPFRRRHRCLKRRRRGRGRKEEEGGVEEDRAVTTRSVAGSPSSGKARSTYLRDATPPPEKKRGAATSSTAPSLHRATTPPLHQPQAFARPVPSSRWAKGEVFLPLFQVAVSLSTAIGRTRATHAFAKEVGTAMATRTSAKHIAPQHSIAAPVSPSTYAATVGGRHHSLRTPPLAPTPPQPSYGVPSSNTGRLGGHPALACHCPPRAYSASSNRIAVLGSCRASSAKTQSKHVHPPDPASAMLNP